jgi:endonuclease G
MSQQTFHFHGPTTINILDGQATIEPVAARGLAPPADLSPAAALGALLQKKQEFDPNYDARSGYDSGFLGVTIPLPDVGAERAREMLKGPNHKAMVLHYHHYSLAMNKARRLLMWAASNVDYSPEMRGSEKRKDFGGEEWRLDPRIPPSLQVDDGEFYRPARKIDRGHIVRREDTTFGPTATERAFANADTYHWTNCTPQHERFNRGSENGVWGKLEAQIKSEAVRNGAKLSVFAGPVLDADDPEALGIQFPLKFWKVIAAVEDGALRAYGFMLDQGPVVDEDGIGAERALNFNQFKEQQCSLKEIETQTGVAFARVLHAADVMAGQRAIEINSEIDVVRPAQRGVSAAAT